MERSLIRGYHFTMLPGGAWTTEGDCRIYTGPCDLKLDLVSDGSVMHFPAHHAFREVSFTLPGRRPEPAIPSTQSATPCGPTAVGPRFSDGPCGDHFPSALGKRGRSPDAAEEAIRAEDIAGPSRRRTMWDDYGNSTESGGDMQCSDPVEEVAVDDTDDCVELICVEDSVEVVDLVSDSEPEEDPSECSSAPASLGASH